MLRKQLSQVLHPETVRTQETNEINAQSDNLAKYGSGLICKGEHGRGISSRGTGVGQKPLSHQ